MGWLWMEGMDLKGVGYCLFAYTGLGFNWRDWVKRKETSLTAENLYKILYNSQVQVKDATATESGQALSTDTALTWWRIWMTPGLLSSGRSCDAKKSITQLTDISVYGSQATTNTMPTKFIRLTTTRAFGLSLSGLSEGPDIQAKAEYAG
jgi:hypothetical protein